MRKFPFFLCAGIFVLSVTSVLGQQPLMGPASATPGSEPTIDRCLAYLASHPDDYQVYDQIGILYARQNDLTNAERFFRKAVRINRLYSKGYFNLGVLKLNLGDYNAAVENFVASVTFATDDIQGLINLGNIYNIRNDSTDAFHYYQRAFKLNMHDADLLNNLGIIAIKQKKYPEAAGFLLAAWQASKDEDIRLNLAIAYYYSAEYAKIRELYPVLDPQQKHYSTIIQLLGR